jgi:hypothetical protein
MPDDQRGVRLVPPIGLAENDEVWVFQNLTAGPWYRLRVLSLDEGIKVEPNTADEDPAFTYIRVELPADFLADFPTRAERDAFLNGADWKRITPLNPSAFTGRTFANFHKTDFRFMSELPTILNPGDEWDLIIRFEPRWSTGFDRERETVSTVATQPFTNAVPVYPTTNTLWHWVLTQNPTTGWPWDVVHPMQPVNPLIAPDLPLGWTTTRIDNKALWRGNTSERDASYSEAATSMVPLLGGMEPRGWVEHLLEVNIPNSDIDTWGDWKTGQVPQTVGLYPHPRDEFATWFTVDFNIGEYLDGVHPDFEFALMGIGRNPRSVLSEVDDPWKIAFDFVPTTPYDSIHAPYLPATLLRRAPTAFVFPDTEVLQTNTRTLTLTAGPNMWTDTLNYYGGTYLPTGRLLLDPDPGRTFKIQGAAPSDYFVVVDTPASSDADNNPSDPWNPERHGLFELISGESIVLDVTFAPTAVTDLNNLQANPVREATLVIPTNDATEDPYRLTLQGNGLAPAVPPPPPESDG